MKIYKVGGAVRDNLLGLTSKDSDFVVVGADVEQMLEMGFEQVGKAFPVFLHPKTKQEYALARLEKKQGSGHQQFQFEANAKVSLEQDLKRRDLTINAIAQDEQGHLIDPFGGLEDLKKRKLRHVGAAFVEDPLRVFRVARFLARFSHLGFRLDPSTKMLMVQIIQSGELKTLSLERILQETQLALLSQSPWQYFELLEEIGALDQTPLKGMFADFDAALKKHWRQRMQRISTCCNDLQIRFIACLHLSRATTLDNFCKQMPLSKELKANLLQSCKWLKHFKQPLNSRAYWRFFCELDVLRKPQNLVVFAKAWLLLENLSTHDLAVKKLLQSYWALLQVDAGQLIHAYYENLDQAVPKQDKGKATKMLIEKQTLLSIEKNLALFDNEVYYS